MKESSVAWLVTKVYRQNPRQIKQFINQLISMYILAKKRIGKKSLPADFLDGNIPKLAKFLILYNKFPEQMKKLRQRKIWELEQAALDTTIGDDLDFAEFNKFLKQTSQIQIDDLNIFFTLRRSEFEVQLPGCDEFVTALKDNRVDEATSYMQALTEFTTKKAILSQTIKKVLEETNLPDTKISIINSCLTGLSSLNERLEDMLYAEMVNELLNLKQYLYIIEPKVVFDQLLKHYPQYRDDFALIYVDLLAQEEEKIKLPIKFAEALFSEIIRNAEWFKLHVNKLNNIIMVKYYDKPEIIKMFLLNKDIQKIFAIGKVIQKTISKLSSADLEDSKLFDEKIYLLINTAPDILDKELVISSMIKLTEVISDENTKLLDSTRLEIRKRLLKSITVLLEKHLTSLSEKSGQKEKDALCHAVITGIEQISDLGQRSIYIEPLILLSSIGSSVSSQIVKTVKDFINKAPFEGLLEAFEDKDKERWRELLTNKNYTENFKQRALKEQKAFDYLYPYLTEAQRKDWLLALLDADPLRGIQKIESLDLKFPDIENVLKKLLVISEKVDLSIRFKVYELSDKIGFANNEELLQQVCEDAKKYLITLNESYQKLGYKISLNIASFKDIHKRDIVRKVIDWLISLQPDQIYQPIPIQTVLELWTTLSEQSIIQKSFIEYIFHLLLSTANIDAIKLGMEVLEKTKADYSDYKKYYDDLKHRSETESNAAIKEMFVQGFKELKMTMGEHVKWLEGIDSIEEKTQ